MTLIKVLDFERQLVKWSGSGQTGGFSDREMERKEKVEGKWKNE